MASKMKRLGGASVLLGLALWALLAAILPAQTSELPATADTVIEEMAAAAGVIFAGQVTAVRGPTGFAGGSVVEVDLRVDRAVRAPAAGSVYTLREWAGLWNGSGSRYRVGQRLLLFLYAPDTNGLSSPVHGMDGAVPLRGGLSAPGPDDSSSAATQWMVDLRWLQAQTVRGDVEMPIPGPGTGGHRPVRRWPVWPHPISELTLDGRTERSAMEVEPALARRLPVGGPPPVATGEAQPLSLVIALCQKAVGQKAAGQKAVGQQAIAQQPMGREIEGLRTAGGQSMRRTDAAR